MREWISDIKAELYKLQLYLEKRSAIHLFFILLYGFLSGIVTFYDFINILSSLPKIVFSLLNLLLIIFLLILDAIHVKMIKNNRTELDGRKSLINELISTQPPYYKVKYRREFHDIEKDGNSFYHREMILSFDNVDVAWAEISLASTNTYGNDYSKMILHVKTFPHAYTNLSRIPIESDGPRLRYAIILRKKLTRENPSEGFQAIMKWREVWKALIEYHKDDGLIRFEHDTDEWVLELVFPQGYRITDFRIPRANGELIKGEKEDGRSYIIYKLRDQKKGEVFQYFIEVEKVS